MRLILLTTVAVAIGSAQVGSESAEMDPQDVKLTLKLAEESPVFRVGEPIRVKMLFTSSTPGKYVLTNGATMRGSPFQGEIHLEPPELAVDPRKALYQEAGTVGDCFSGWAPLTEEPSVVEFNLNEWFVSIIRAFFIFGSCHRG